VGSTHAGATPFVSVIQVIFSVAVSILYNPALRVSSWFKLAYPSGVDSKIESRKLTGLAGAASSCLDFLHISTIIEL
jgi:hypothetical protein